MPAGQCAQLRKLGVCLRACRGLFCAEIGLGPDVLYMIHPASRLEVILHSRADGRSAVKSAAYTARTTFRDARVGRRFSPGRKGGLLSHELINWTGNAEELWNAAEHSERRRNARVIRELRRRNKKKEQPARMGSLSRSLRTMPQNPPWIGRNHLRSFVSRPEKTSSDPLIPRIGRTR